MNRFSRDYALVRSNTGQIVAESHYLDRLEKLRAEFAEQDVECEVVKSDLPRFSPLTISQTR